MDAVRPEDWWTFGHVAGARDGAGARNLNKDVLVRLMQDGLIEKRPPHGKFYLTPAGEDMALVRQVMDR